MPVVDTAPVQGASDYVDAADIPPLVDALRALHAAGDTKSGPGVTVTVAEDQGNKQNYSWRYRLAVADALLVNGRKDVDAIRQKQDKTIQKKGDKTSYGFRLYWDRLDVDLIPEAVVAETPKRGAKGQS